MAAWMRVEGVIMERRQKIKKGFRRKSKGLYDMRGKVEAGIKDGSEVLGVQQDRCYCYH